MTDKVRMRRMSVAIMIRRWKRVFITPILVSAPWHKLTHPFQFSTLTKRTPAQLSLSPGAVHMVEKSADICLPSLSRIRDVLMSSVY